MHSEVEGRTGERCGWNERCLWMKMCEY